MKTVLIVFSTLLCAAACKLQAASSVDSIYLKNHTSISVDIASIDSFAVYFSNGKLLGLKTIDSISTAKPALVSGAQQLFPSLTIRNMGSTQSLIFNGLSLPTRIPEDKRIIERFSAYLYYYWHNQRSNLEVQLSCQCKGLKGIEFELGAGATLTPYREGLSIYYYQILGQRYEQVTASHFFVGAGCSHSFGRIRGRMFLDIGEQRYFSSSTDIQTGMLVFLSPYVETNVFNSHCILAIGSHIYLNKSSMHPHSSIATFNVGIGYTL